MQEFILLTSVSLSAFLLMACNSNSQIDVDQASKEVWKIIKAHNKARFELEDINEYLNKSFFDFINSYRIEEAKHYLLNSSKDFSTILEVSYEVGFNSEATFNHAFKKHTGMNPTEFKRLHHIH